MCSHYADTVKKPSDKKKSRTEEAEEHQAKGNN